MTTLPPWPAGATTPREPRALSHVIIVLQQRLSDGGHIHVERAMTWNELRNVSRRNYEIGKMIEQMCAEVQTRCGLR